MVYYFGIRTYDQGAELKMQDLEIVLLIVKLKEYDLGFGVRI